MHLETVGRSFIARHLTSWLFVLFGVVFSVQALAANAIIESAYFEDPSNALTLEQAQSQDFAPFQIPLNKLFSASTFWIRLKISAPPAAHQSQMYVLRMQPGYIDSITLYDPVQGEKPLPPVGDRNWVPKEGYTALNHNFTLPSAAQEREIWLKLKTSSVNLLQMEVLPIFEAQSKDVVQELMYGLVVGLLAVLVLVSIINFRNLPDVVSVLLVLNQISGLLYSLLLWGYARFAFGAWVDPAVLNAATNMAILSTVGINSTFNFFFLKSIKGSWRPAWWILPWMLLYPLDVGLYWAGEVRWALTLNLVSVIAVSISYVLTIASPSHNLRSKSFKEPIFSQRTLLLMYMPLAFIAFGIAMPVLGLIPSTAATIQTIQPLYFCVSGLVAVFSMVYRTGAVERSRQATLVQLQLAEQETQLERDRVRTQNQMLSMLSHELKTPLSVMRMALGWLGEKPEIHAKARAAVQDMNEVINRVLLLNKIQGRTLVLQQKKIPLRDAIGQAISLHPQSESERIEFDAQREADVLADPLLLKTVLRNVIDNALRYSPAGSNVEVVMQEQMRHTRGVAVSVRNQLLGEDRPDTAKLFTQFYRSAGAQHQTGSGLGLFISKELMVQMSGDLTFNEESAPWVSFTLWLPL